MGARGRIPAMLGFAALLAGCAGFAGGRPRQGLSGTFTTYGPAGDPAACAALLPQWRIDSCRQENGRVIEEPFRGALVIRNLGTREAKNQALDPSGTYRVDLEPGTYEVCVEGECSDPIEVRMGAYATYGQRLPRPAARAVDASPK